MTSAEAPRILVVDDDLGVIASYRHVFERLTRPAEQEPHLQLERELFGTPTAPARSVPRPLAVDYADSGNAALQHVRAALQEGRPYAVIFLDMRMPPGPDGLATAKAIRLVDASVHIVFVTGFSDYGLEQLADQVRPAERLHYMHKPVAPANLRKVASALTTLWAGE